MDRRNNFIFPKLACWSKQYLQGHLLVSTHKFLAGTYLLNEFGFISIWERLPLFWRVDLKRVLANLSTWCGWKFTHILQTNKNIRNLKWTNFDYFIKAYTSPIIYFLSNPRASLCSVSSILTLQEWKRLWIMSNLWQKLQVMVEPLEMWIGRKSLLFVDWKKILTNWAL